MKLRTASLATLSVLTLAAASACGSGSGGAAGSTSSDGTSSGTAASSGEKVQVIAAFYPLQYAVERVGGAHVTVTNLTKPGAEPHDLELTPQDVAKVTGAELAVYTKGFQPAVDKAIGEQSAKGAYDVSKDADLEAHDEGAEADHQHTPGDGHDHGTTDPHFWLDPQRYAKVAKGIAAKLGEVDPGRKADYEKNADGFAKDLTALDGEFAAGLKSCTNKNLVTSHAAFGYLAERYGLTQQAIAGLSPDKEPEPARLAEIAAFAKKNKVRTIYTETLVSPTIAKTVAAETGAQTAVLDPIEGLSDASAGKDYLEVMRANLATLKKGQPCP